MKRPVTRGLVLLTGLACAALANTAASGPSTATSDPARASHVEAPRAPATQPERDYILACGGCHGFKGVSNPTLVPSLSGMVGYFLNLPEGRAYLARLPNVAYSSLTDEQLAAVLNYVITDIGGSSAPAGITPYSPREVGSLRTAALTEVSLRAYRSRLVDLLIADYRAPAALRGYAYGPPPDTAATGP